MVFTRLFLIVLVCVLLLHSAVSEESKRKPRKKNRKYNPQREALQTWASDLEPELGKQTPYYVFHSYIVDTMGSLTQYPLTPSLRLQFDHVANQV